MMMPFTFGVPVSDIHDSLNITQTSPELRRMDIHNRARREEMDALMYNLNPRQSVAYGKRARSESDMNIVSKFFNGMRTGIGSLLINAGTRMQSPV